MSDVAAVKNLVSRHQRLKQEIAKRIVGQEKVIDQILLSVFSGGHSLLIGVPGLAKNPDGEYHCPGSGTPLQKDPVYARSYAQRHPGVRDP